jgi:hypothetical protein
MQVDDMARTRPPVPALAKLGAATIAFGLLADLVEHSMGAAARAGTTGPGAGEHAVHLVVLIGMVLVLAGVIADGVRHNGRSRPEGSPRDAVR